MSGSHSLTAVEPSEYDLIEAAMSESARGRWFLGEYARRNRSADTDILLGAIHRLENAVTAERGPDGLVRLRGDLMEMANAIARTKAEIAAISAPEQDQTRLSVASEALDAIVRATERATSDILGAAEEVQEAAWTLREHGADPAICDELDRRATQIYTACSFQDLTAQRTGRIVHTLRYLEERLVAMIAIWGDDSDEIPPAPGEEGARSRPASESKLDDLCQSDVDRFIDMDASVEMPAVRAAAVSAVPLHEDLAFVPAAVTILDDGPAARIAVPVETIVDEAFEADIGFAEADLEFGLASAKAEPITAEEIAEAMVLTVSAATFDAETAEDELDGSKQAGTEADKTSAATAASADKAIDFADLDALSIEEKLALFS
ncbi:hypothetical protein [Methylobacterium nigriterrae]|uniref:hypothetical protein n=1 Tax=Methylobacterium nigriterrae TaxID=3127512 RepID=UPI0030140495